MLIRFVAKNIFSFRDQIEFNLLPNRSQNLPHHKVKVNDIEFLRFGAIYGANASGKSNLIKAISLLQSTVKEGKILLKFEDYKFKLSKASGLDHEPISLGVEFKVENTVFYYSLSVSNRTILHEYLAESTKQEDKVIFERELISGSTKIELSKNYLKTEKDKLFAEILAEKLILSDELLLTFLGNKYSNSFKEIFSAFNWFRETLIVLFPDSKPQGLAYNLDSKKDLLNFTKTLLPTLNLGIESLEVERKNLKDYFSDDLPHEKDLEKLRVNPEKMVILKNSFTGEEISIVNENGELVGLKLKTIHKNEGNEKIVFDLFEESDGTVRLLEYIPALQEIIHKPKVYVIDEIERSIHPIIMKEIINKLTSEKNLQGQLIFSTHETNLLDQDSLRTDEIWFVEKDDTGCSKLYSLSDFKTHHTLSLEKGYLKGRFGGIPFLNNLQTLNW